MAQLTIITNVRILIYGLKLFFTGAYTMDTGGNIRFSSKTRIAIYIVNVVMVALLQYSLLKFFPPKDIYSNAYALLGYARTIVQAMAASAVTLWNTHFCEKASQAISELIKINNHLSLTKRQMKWITGVILGEIAFVFSSTIFSVYYIHSRWGLSLLGITKIITSYVEICNFSAELMFVNIMILLNIDAKILYKEIWDVLRTEERAFDLVFIRDLVIQKNKRGKESKVDKLNRIRVLYEKIYDVKENVHEVFSFTLLMTTATTFGNTVFFVFVNTVRFRYGTEMTTKNFLLSFLYPVFIFTKLSTIVTVCSRFKNKLKNAASASTKLYQVADNESEYNSVTGLVQELKHMDPDITCYRFTVIDYELVSSIIGTIITYTIILLQTKFTEDEQDPLSKLLFEF